MSHTRRLTLAFVGALVALIALVAGGARAQSPALPNPYRLAEKWAQLPAGMQWAGVISVDPDARDNIWVFHRSDPTILKFDPSGKLVASFGAGMFVQAHGMTIDRDGNIWVTDAQNKDGKGQQVFKLSPEGKVLMTLGKAGVAGEGPDTFSGPADVVVAPNGDIFVADGHAAMANGRIVKFSKDGKFVKAWGKTGTGPGEFNVPHSIAMDSQGPPLRRRSQQQPPPDLRSGRQVPRSVEAVRPAERRLHRQERHHLRRRLAVERHAEPRLHARRQDRQRQGRQGHRLHSRHAPGSRQEQQRRRGRRHGRFEGQHLRRRRHRNGAQEIRALASRDQGAGIRD